MSDLDPTGAPLADAPDDRYQVVSSEDLHRDDWIVALRADRIRKRGTDDEPFRRLTVEHPGAVVVLALDDDRRVLVLRQYRHPVRHRLVELPAGLRDAGDEPALETAKRELREEAELAADHWEELLDTWSSPGLIAERIAYFVATGLHAVDRGDFELHHEEADMERLWVPFDDLLAAVLDGRVADGPVVQAVAVARIRGIA